MATETERLLHQAEARLIDLNHELGAAVSKAKTPDAPELVAIDQAIEEQGAKIRRLQRMLAAGQVAASAEAKRELMKKREDGRTNAVRIARERIALAGKIDDAIAALTPLLREWDSAGVECHKFACDVNRKVPGMDWNGGMLNFARGNNGSFSGALENTLLRAGVGQEGIYCHELAILRSSGSVTLKSAAEYAAKTLEAQLENILETAKRKEEA